MQEYKGIYIGLKLLCRDEFMSKFSNSLIYRWRKAEVLATERFDRSRVLIHYTGWSKTFDLWIDLLLDINRIAPIDMIDEENAYKGISLTEEQLKISIYYFQSGQLILLNHNINFYINTDCIDNTNINTDSINNNPNTHSNFITNLEISHATNNDIITTLSTNISNSSYRKVSKRILSINTTDLRLLDESSNEFLYFLHKRLKLFHIGLQIEVLDIFYKKGSISPTYKWRLSEVIGINEKDGVIIMHYINWSNRYDEGFHVIFDADRLRATNITNKVLSLLVEKQNSQEDSLNILEEFQLSINIKQVILENVSTIKSSLESLEEITIPNVVRTSIHSVVMSVPAISEEIIKTFTTHNTTDADDVRVDNMSNNSIESDHKTSHMSSNHSETIQHHSQKNNTSVHSVYNSLEDHRESQVSDTNIKTTEIYNNHNNVKYKNNNDADNHINNNDADKKTASNNHDDNTKDESSYNNDTKRTSSKTKNQTSNKLNIKKYTKKILKYPVKKIFNWFIIQPKQSSHHMEDKLNPISLSTKTSMIDEEYGGDDIIHKQDISVMLIVRDQQFISALESKGLHVFSIQGDGNCLFRAVSHQLYMNQDKHEELRNKVVTHLIEHRDRFELFCDEDYDEHINAMRKVNTWGDDLEIRALEEITDRLIRIYRSDQEHFDEPMHDNNIEEQVLLKDISPIILSYHGSNHYNSVYDEKYPPLPLTLRTSKILLRTRMKLNGIRDVSSRVIQSSKSNYDSSSSSNNNNSTTNNNDNTDNIKYISNSNRTIKTSSSNYNNNSSNHIIQH